MIVEVIAVGTELLLGQIVNSNAAYIGDRLAEEGFDAHFQVAVGDNLERIVSALESALGRSDAVILTGGIGPTQDDMTREALCRLRGLAMSRDQAHAAWIRRRVLARRGSVPDSVLRMADLPQGAEGLPNINGVALGVALRVGDKAVFAVPGVPAEMRAMIDREVVPRLHDMGGGPAVVKSRVLRTWGLGESKVAELLDDLYGTTNPSIAFLIKDMEVLVRVTAKAADSVTAGEMIEPIEEEVRSRLGEAVFAVGPTLVEEIIVATLLERGWSIGTVEEASLGGVGSRLAAADGSGQVYAGSLISGDGLSADITVAADVVVSVGPIGAESEGGPRTTRPVEVEVTTPDGVTKRVFELGGDDERVRTFAAIAALHLVRIALLGELVR